MLHFALPLLMCAVLLTLVASKTAQTPSYIRAQSEHMCKWQQACFCSRLVATCIPVCVSHKSRKNFTTMFTCAVPCTTPLPFQAAPYTPSDQSHILLTCALPPQQHPLVEGVWPHQTCQPPYSEAAPAARVSAGSAHLPSPSACGVVTNDDGTLATKNQ